VDVNDTMTYPSRQAVFTGLIVTAVLTLAACGGDSGSTNGGVSPNASAGSLAGQTITMYNGQHEQTTDALVKAFESATGVKVNVRNDDEDVLAQQIGEEGSRSPADVFFTENTPPLARLDEQGLLAPVDATTLAKVPAKDSGTDHNWVGVSARLSMLVYNTDDLQPAELPRSIYDLADPTWKGKLDIAPAETDFAPIVTSIAQDRGSDAAVAWLKAIKENAGAHQDPDNETLVANVNKGVTELGVINHYYWYRLRAEVGTKNLHSALATFANGDDGYLLNVSGAGVLKSSQHQAAAQALVNFIVSAKGQKVLTDSDSWEYPLGSHVTNPALPPLSHFHPRDFDLSQIGDGSKAVTLLQQAGLL
jgi:iron(III) transport system substrate-binding protein